ncbi:phosphotransferase family protein [Mycobacterium intracellulare]|uniref:Phosphotransferase family protein n=1 Tax=Mycobacterium intracellulare subsp. chimaera TaxID=222805 RepID=A0ABT7P2I0_MYCIT|nr:phosphotransferase family protein [Mycobacterium intracellulare]MDM3927493.1 phosphotransferase family protein [Mycobacterium intracellulare subsp. chimaera]
MNAPDPRITPALVWMTEQVSGASEPLSYQLITGGRSNLTYRVTGSCGRSWILRRQPTGPLAARAHDLRREYRILSALSQHTALPVPEPIALCEDESILGVTFYVMADVPGTVLRDPTDTAELAETTRSAAARHAVEALAALHSVDLDRAGLADLGPRDGYVARQLRRWLSQVEQTCDVDAFHRLGEQQAALADALPRTTETSLVHGDYRFDNLVLDPRDGTVRAILDWEIAALGDPLADLGYFLVSWDEPGDERPALGLPGPTSAEGFPSRRDATEWYASARAIDVDVLDFYLAFGYWKLACVLHCVDHRYRTGGGGGAGSDALPLDMAEHVSWLTHRSTTHLTRHKAATR